MKISQKLWATALIFIGVAAAGRWRSGYIDPTDKSEATIVNEKFLKCMNGTSGTGRQRAAGEAYGGGIGYTSNVKGVFFGVTLRS